MDDDEIKENFKQIDKEKNDKYYKLFYETEEM